MKPIAFGRVLLAAFAITGAGTWFGGGALSRAVAATTRPPNIVCILADDLGYADLGCYGQQKILTPSLDRMADEGIRFTQAYCGTSVCAPSRCILMTGLHAGHAHIRANRGGGFEGEEPLPAGTFTVARMLQQAGYRTACIGKWGLGGPRSTGAPNKQGFDHFFGYTSHGQAHEYYPDHLWRDGQRVELDGKTYSHDLIAEEALNWIRENQQRPFFLYLPFTIPHAKLQVPDLGRYADEPWTPEAKAIAAMITRMDHDVGRLLALLKTLDLDDRTILFFASDNGPDRGRTREFFKASSSLRGTKRSMYEGGLRVPMVVRWPGRVPSGRVSDQPWAFWDFLPTCAELAGIRLPGNLPLDGVSVVPALLGGSVPDREYFYWELHEPVSSQAVRFGSIKAVRPRWTAAVEIYDLSTDPGEAHNLASNRPDLLVKGEALLGTARVDSSLWPIITTPPPTRPAGAAASRPASVPETSAPRTVATRPVVGAIRWDAWFGRRNPVGEAVHRTLADARWRDRLPFYAKLSGENALEIDGTLQETMDLEIGYAAGAGLDYWAFVTYSDGDPLSLGLERYLSSRVRSRVHFCLITECGRWPDPAFRDRVLRLMQEPGYQRVLDGRPLLYVGFIQEKCLQALGGIEGFRKVLDDLRDGLAAKGVARPYVVVMDFTPVKAKEYADALGADAITSYVAGIGQGAIPYQRMTENIGHFWENCRRTGVAVVPVVATGWDPRPRVENPTPWGAHYSSHEGEVDRVEPATPEAIADQLGRALRWMNDHRTAAPARAVIVYAWNEFDEGGWLCPTLSEGTARLEAIARVLEPARSTASSPAP